jgi:protein SCO1/2
MRMSKLSAPFALGLALALTACGQKQVEQKAESLPAACTGRSSSAIGGAFSLVDQDNKPVTQADFLGKPTLMYFGFTYCPDICPMTLTRLKAALDELGPQAAGVNTVFVTVDPERDTPAALKLYLGNSAFPAGIRGLTGSPEQIDAVKKTFRVSAQKTPDPDSAAGYQVSHTSITYLLNNKGEMASFFPDDTSPTDLAACLKASLDGRL